jgi:hypothetical protein
MNEIIVEEVRRVIEELIRCQGGIDEYLKYCQAQDLTRASRLKARSRKIRTPTRKPREEASNQLGMSTPLAFVFSSRQGGFIRGSSRNLRLNFRFYLPRLP